MDETTIVVVRSAGRSCSDTFNEGDTVGQGLSMVLQLGMGVAQPSVGVGWYLIGTHPILSGGAPKHRPDQANEHRTCYAAKAWPRTNGHVSALTYTAVVS